MGDLTPLQLFHTLKKVSPFALISPHPPRTEKIAKSLPEYLCGATVWPVIDWQSFHIFFLSLNPGKDSQYMCPSTLQYTCLAPNLVGYFFTF